MNILLQILDEGRITDAQGRTVNFENTIIVMTSNAGSERKSGALGFGKEKGDATREKIMKALSEFLRPEFIGRVDEIAIFNALTVENYEEIAQLLLSELAGSLKEKDIEFKWNSDVAKNLAENSHGGQRGARDLRNLIRKKIEDKIANIIIDNADSVVSGIAAEVKNGEIELSHI